MAEFTVINTQEEFDAAIKDRLDRQRKADAQKFEGYVSPEDHEKAIAELQTKLDAYAEKDARITELEAENGKLNVRLMKSRIADELGLDRKWLSRVAGTDEKTIRADVQALVDMIPKSGAVLPQANPETMPSESKEEQAMKALLKNIKGE